MPAYHIATLQVRGRPVEVVDDNGYTAVWAKERGHFPVSYTGYRSLAGIRPEAVTSELLEALAVQADRERRQLIREVQVKRTVTTLPLWNHKHTLYLAEDAAEQGFFALTDSRQTLWVAAHRLCSMIARDSRYHPVPDGIWTREACTKAMERVHVLKSFLEKWCRGEFPTDAPVGLHAARAYTRLSPGGIEPRIEVFNAPEFAFEIEHRPPTAQLRTTRRQIRPEECAQMSLFARANEQRPGFRIS